MKLLTIGNPKTAKGEGLGYLTAILHLAPSDLSGKNVCPNASPGCIAACLNTAGRGGIFRKGETTNVIQEARIRRTRTFFADRPGFFKQLEHEIGLHIRNAARHGLKPAVRLNGTSDLAWERIFPSVFRAYPDLQFYDYTKSVKRMLHFTDGFRWPKNYHLTFSKAENNSDACLAVYAKGGNVAVVFDRVPSTFWGGPVIDADQHDLRFLDPAGVTCGLKAKGKAKKDSSGFVVQAIGGLA